MVPRAAIAAVLLALLAGCVAQPQETPAATSADPQVVIDESRPDTAFNEVVTGPAVGPDLDATLDAAPKLIAGEWWRLRFTSPVTGFDADVVRVVAAVEPDGYVIGMPHEGWAKEVISYHAPALGDVGLDLSYATHNKVFAPVKFPLTVGSTWETDFATTPFTVKVESIEGLKATLSYTPRTQAQPTDPLYAAAGFSGDNTMSMVYDASTHEIVHYESPIGGYDVVEHGYGFEGWVTIPRAEHTAIDYGQFGPVTPGEPPVKRTIEVEGGFNRLTLMHVIFPLAPGAYRITSVAPDGTEFVTESMDGSLQFKLFEASDPDGTWNVEDLVAGGGATYSMGIAYHQYDIRLPDGAKRSDHSHPVIR